MKKILEVAIVVVLAVALFTLSMYVNVLQRFSFSLIGVTAIYFISGLTFRGYYNKKHFIIPFLVVTLSLISFGWVVSDRKFFVSWLFAALIISYAVGFFILKINWKWRITSLTILFLALFYIAFRVLPENSYSDSQRNSKLIGKSIYTLFNDQIKLKDAEGNIQDLSILCSEQVCLLEFYFNGCAPCKQKEKPLDQIADQHKDKPFKIIYINAGNIDSFQNFKNALHKDLRLYDEFGNFAKALEAKEFPTEIIIDKAGIIRSVSIGYTENTEHIYLDETKRKIKTLM